MILNKNIIDILKILSKFASNDELTMLLSLIYSLPCIVSLIWFFTFILKEKNYRQRLFCIAEGTSAVFYIILAIYFFPNADYDLMVRMETICLPFGLIFSAFIIAYMYMHCFDRKLSERYLFMLVTPSIMISVAIGVLCYVLGFDKAALISQDVLEKGVISSELDNDLGRTYHFFTYYVVEIMGALNIIIMFVLCFATLYRQHYRFGDIFRFFFRGKSTTRSRTIAVMYIVENILLVYILMVGSRYFISHPVPGVFAMLGLAATKHIIAYLEFYSEDTKMVTLYDLSHLVVFDYSSEKAGESDYAVSELPSEQSILTAAQIKMDARLEEFRELMEVKKSLDR